MPDCSDGERPSVKLATTQQRGLALVETQGTYVELSGHGLALTRDGQQQQIP